MAYITAAEVKAIRLKLKEVFGKKFKFSVRKESGGLSVNVDILRGTVDFTKELRPDGTCSVNHYWINDHFDGERAEFLNKVHDIIRTAPAEAGGREWFDKSDAMTDYFNTAYYYHMSVGTWDKPYELVA